MGEPRLVGDCSPTSDLAKERVHHEIRLGLAISARGTRAPLGVVRAHARGTLPATVSIDSLARLTPLDDLQAMSDRPNRRMDALSMSSGGMMHHLRYKTANVDASDDEDGPPKRRVILPLVEPPRTVRPHPAPRARDGAGPYHSRASLPARPPVSPAWPAPRRQTGARAVMALPLANAM